MRTKVLLVVAALLMAIVSTVAIGSNMGFKISIPITAGTTAFISLPYYCTVDGQSVDGGSATASNLRNDLIAAGGTSVEVYNFNGSIWQRYAGGAIGDVNFSLSSGVGYQVISGTNISGWVVVGSHNPSKTVTFQAGVTNFVAVPYHSTASTASQLRAEIIAAGGTSVEVYNFTGTIWQRYAGGAIGDVDFAIVPGTAYQVISGSGVSWTPAHY